MSLLKNGLKVISRSNNEYEIIKQIGFGGQGEIYLVQSGGKDHVLKVYFKSWATPVQKSILNELIEECDPPSPYFVWPYDFVEFPDIPSFGFIMRFVDLEKYVSLDSKRFEEEGVNLFADLTYAILLVDSYFKLHMRALCYADISATNIYFKKDATSVKIFDTDNIIENGKAGLVGGTLPFKAPELITGKTIYPTIDTDRYSLSIALFLLLFRNHPMHGKNHSSLLFFEVEQMMKLYGENPVFIFDLDNDENRPDNPEVDEQRIANILWAVYPDYIKNLMITSFTKGLRNPHSRVREITWRRALMKLRDSIVRCPRCNTENFFNPSNGSECTCWHCSHSIQAPPMMQITGPGFTRLVMLNEGGIIYRGHLDNYYDLRKKIGKIEKRTDICKIFGLTNLSSTPWNYQINDGDLKTTPPERGVCITDKIKIHFSKDVIGTFIT